MKIERPKIVCLCGSTRFYDAFQQANCDETLLGHIVLTVGVYSHSSNRVHGAVVVSTPAQETALENLHLRKIDLADEVLVLNVGGYIGEGLRREIAYAIANSVPLRFLEPTAGEAWLIQNTHDLGRRVAAVVLQQAAFK